MSPVPAAPAASTASPVSPSNAALYNFKLLAALRSGNRADVQPYLDELKTSAPEGAAGRLLGMAVRVATGELF